VNVVVDTAAGPRQHVVASLSLGKSFGALALLDDAPRSATVMCATEKVQVLSLHREHYNDCIRSFHKRDLEEKHLMIQQCELFTNIPSPDARLLANFTTLSLKKKGDLVVKAKDKAEYVYVLRSGTCHGVCQVRHKGNHRAPTAALHAEHNLGYDKDLSISVDVYSAKAIVEPDGTSDDVHETGPASESGLSSGLVANYFGYEAMMAKEGTYPYDVVAVEDCQVWCIRRGNIMHYVHDKSLLYIPPSKRSPVQLQRAIYQQYQWQQYKNAVAEEVVQARVFCHANEAFPVIEKFSSSRRDPLIEQRVLPASKFRRKRKDEAPALQKTTTTAKK
jgi:CRP-like cAMP-binding protein